MTRGIGSRWKRSSPLAPNVTPSIAARVAATSAAGSWPSSSGAASVNRRIGGPLPGMPPSANVSDDVQALLERHGEAVATVRAFAERSGALRVVLLVDVGDGNAATMLDWAAGTLELTETDGACTVPG